MDTPKLRLELSMTAVRLSLSSGSVRLRNSDLQESRYGVFVQDHNKHLALGFDSQGCLSRVEKGVISRFHLFGYGNIVW